MLNPFHSKPTHAKITNEALLLHSNEPFNAEPPLDRLRATFTLGLVAVALDRAARAAAATAIRLPGPRVVGVGDRDLHRLLFLPNQPTYHVAIPVVSPSLLGFVLLIGPPMGLAAAWYVRLIAWADRRKHHGTLGMLAPVVAFAALGLLAVPLPELLGNGQSEVQDIFTGTLSLLPLLLPWQRRAPADYSPRRSRLAPH